LKKRHVGLPIAENANGVKTKDVEEGVQKA
jgi:hypothetical protein